MPPYCLREGKIKLFRSTSDGSEELVGIITAGECVASGSALAIIPTDVKACAGSSVQVCLIPTEALHVLAEKNRTILRYMAISLCEDLNQARQILHVFARTPVRERVARILHYLGELRSLDRVRAVFASSGVVVLAHLL